MTKATSRMRVARRPVHGVILLDKPLGLSSNGALQKVKWLLRALKAGHTGTLDPQATGVLPLCFGSATKFAQIHLEANKRYQAIVRLGVTTTTGDAEGDIIKTSSVTVSQDQLAQMQTRFMGEITQMPPMYSALKHEGKALYEYAREGIEVERKSRQVTIYALNLHLVDAQTVEMDVVCSKGTYIRTLASDIGDALGCGASLSSLRRLASGMVEIDECITLDALQVMTEEERMTLLKPPDYLLKDLPVITLEGEDAGRFLTGMRRKVDHPDAKLVQVIGMSPNALLGIAQIYSGELIPQRLLSPVEIKEWLEQSQNK